MKKRILTLLLTLSLLLLPLSLFSGCADEEGGDVTTLYVYNWGEYISDGSEGTVDVNDEFERWYYDTYGERIEVNYSTFSSNESLYAKISSGSVNYDVIVPSDYMIERLIDEGLLAKLDYSNIKSIGNILPQFQNADYDPDTDGNGYNDYSVPYLYGMIGIIYNTDLVDTEDIGSWDLMWNEKYTGNILQFNNSRDAFGSAMYYLGLGDQVNSDNEAHWLAALEALKAQKPILQGYVMDEIYNKMENGSAAIAAYYAGDYLTMYENNEKLEFYYPEEGTNLYVDAMCVPKSSQNKLAAERYIDFMLSVDEAYGAPAIANAEYTYYASPNRAVIESEDYIAYMNDIKEGGYDLMYPAAEDAVPTSSYRNLKGDKLLLLNNLWEELKSDITVSGGIYAICGVIIFSLTGLGIFLYVRKRRRKKYTDTLWE
ncbi:MAG: spermidine/putrescine ABC transporter substrate-binding protein [Clostridia bacterium]|nr:spermidine/putrescine ABC transporter substrate-binding protein [Clostridia bacterium]